VTSGTAIASGSGTSSAPGEPTIRDTRAVAARGRIVLNRGRWRAQGRGLRGGVVLVAKIGINNATINECTSHWLMGPPVR